MSKGKGGYNMGGMNRNQMMAQARKMQEQLVAAQEKAAATEFSASAGGGMVKVTATGDLRLTSVTIDPQALDPDDVDMLQDMIVAAVNDVLEQAESSSEQAMSSLAGGLNIPGLF
ncbi:MAG: YbaB/EbfC family nucleoid-associated protein [Tractidigestivibacter sp.]|jgi:DNA-binding YbaB/EbfC family protein|uniref:YbaB/EbfC family nucleoid-associated protein n=1 Tax=Tractidigestivibacter sp. TaxID=2847320 RepID=UPI003D94D0B3